MKRIVALLLSAILLLTLVGCDLPSFFDNSEKLVGTWITRIEDIDENRDHLLSYIELYDDEIALVNAKAYTGKALTFKADGTYTIGEDVQTLKVCVREFYDDVFADLYAGRAQLAETYAAEGYDLSQMSKDEFYTFYTELYGHEDYEALLDDLVENAYDYSTIEPYERGTFTATGSKITFDATEDEDDGSAAYSLSGTKLTVTYSDGTETYDKR